MHPWEHFKTITNHKMLVMKLCFELGMYKQGLLHDMSKYSPSEFVSGAKYYVAGISPHNIAKEKLGYSPAWLHHKGRNRHHYEYWIDYSVDKSNHSLVGMKMPTKYVVEMFVDRVAACMNYEGDKYTDASAYNYYMRGRDYYVMHPDTMALLENMLIMLKDKGKEYTFKYIKKEILNKDY